LVARTFTTAHSRIISLASYLEKLLIVGAQMASNKLCRKPASYVEIIIREHVVTTTPFLIPE
jgi:hypothetical protein